MLDILQVIGALLILAAFMAAQANRMSQHSVIYLSLNLVGSVILAGLALHTQNWGFLLLEGVWTVVSATDSYRRYGASNRRSRSGTELATARLRARRCRRPRAAMQESTAP